MSGHLRVYIGTPRPGARGLLYDCRMNTADGLTIVTGTVQPLLDTARVLAAKGVTGELELWDAHRPFPRMRGNIERMAAVTISEGQDGLAIRKYVDHAADGDFRPGPSDDREIETGRPGRALQASSSISKVAA